LHPSNEFTESREEDYVFHKVQDRVSKEFGAAVAVWQLEKGIDESPKEQ
jgi:hypothetical protein